MGPLDEAEGNYNWFFCCTRGTYTYIRRRGSNLGDDDYNPLSASVHGVELTEEEELTLASKHRSISDCQVTFDDFPGIIIVSRTPFIYNARATLIFIPYSFLLGQVLGEPSRTPIEASVDVTKPSVPASMAEPSIPITDTPAPDEDMLLRWVL